MLQVEVLIFKLASVDGLSASAVVVGEVSTLAHELGNNAVENRPPVPETSFASAQSTEVLGRLRNNIVTEL